MAEVLFLNDALTHRHIGNSRYIGPYVLASRLESAGFETAVIDFFTRIPDFFAYLENFLEPRTLMVGISSTFLFPEHRGESLGRDDSRGTYAGGALWLDSATELESWLGRLKRLLQRHNPRAKLVLGGVKAVDTIFRRHSGARQFDAIDYLAVGASDQSVVEFATSLRAGEEPRTVLSHGSRVIDNTAHIADKFCPETRFGPRHAVQRGEALPLEISRGCVFNCKFCYFDKRASQRKDLKVLRDEMLRNYEFFGTTVYHFCDDCFNDSRVKIEETCGMFLGLPFKLEWISYARVDLAIRFPNTLGLMIDSGARGLYFGIESFHAEASRKAGKGMAPERVKEFLLDFHAKYRHRCLIQGSFIVGLPGETAASHRDTEEWLLRHDAMDFISMGSLLIAPFDAKLDRLAVDYADYSRDPAKYGFKKIEFDPLYWEHESMNSREAVSLARATFARWLDAGHCTYMKTIWTYPVLRTLGYEWPEIAAMSRDESARDVWAAAVKLRYENYLHRYWTELAERNRPRAGAGAAMPGITEQPWLEEWSGHA
jgi:radical SAM superfamily enzyme YgiQ (UPF0313 family)